MSIRRILYGVANYRTLVKESGYYVAKTAYCIEDYNIAEAGDRFGKREGA